jgi:hypothetical protein
VEGFTGAANSFDFYSSPLSSSMNLLAGDNGNAAVWINNVGGADIIVDVSAAFFDYDSNTGTQTPLVTTATNTGTTIHAGTPVKVNTGPGAGLPADYTIPVGHQLKATVAIDVTSGTATDGRLEYGAPFGSEGDSIVQIPDNRTVSWSFGGVCPIPTPTLSTPVPTLSETAMLGLGLLLAGIGYLLLRRNSSGA